MEIGLVGVYDADTSGFDDWQDILRRKLVRLELRSVASDGTSARSRTTAHVPARPLARCSNRGVLTVELQVPRTRVVLAVPIPHDVLAPYEPSRWGELFGRIPTRPAVDAVAVGLWGRLAAGDEIAAERLGGVLLDLLRIGLSGSYSTIRPPDEDDLAREVRRFIDHHLTDPELSPATIAAAHNISVRQLYRLLSGEPAGVAALVRRRRLERCRQDLCNEQLRSLPAAAISARWGFSSYPHFSRLFRDTYGVPPARYRQRTTVVAERP